MQTTVTGGKEEVPIAQNSWGPRGVGLMGLTGVLAS